MSDSNNFKKVDESQEGDFLSGEMTAPSTQRSSMNVSSRVHAQTVVSQGFKA